jgi:hypothetical protein
LPNNADTQIVKAYVDYLNSILNQTVTDSRLVVLQRSSFLLVTRYQNGELQPLKLTPPSYLHFRQFAQVNAESKVVVQECRYIYSASNDIDAEDKWIFRYEYSIQPEPNVPHAHIHLNAICNGCSIKHIHFPTGRVSLEQIIAHLVLEHGIKPKTADWFNVLKDSHEGFVQRRQDLLLFP